MLDFVVLLVAAMGNCFGTMSGCCRGDRKSEGALDPGRLTNNPVSGSDDAQASRKDMEEAVNRACQAMAETIPTLRTGPPMPTQDQVVMVQNLIRECRVLQNKSKAFLDMLGDATAWADSLTVRHYILFCRICCNCGILQLVVRTMNGEGQDYDVKPHDSIANLKRMIEQQNGVPWSEQIILAVDGA